MLISFSGCMAQQGELTLVANGKSDYALVIPGKPGRHEEKAALILQKYIKQITGYTPVIEREEGFRGSAGIYIGDTYRGGKFFNERLRPESFLIATDNNNVYLKGGGGKGIVYGAYTLLEKYWGCRKYDSGPAIVPKSRSLKLKAGLSDLQLPGFEFRQAYYPAENDPEFLEWHKLHRLDDLFGLWGHSMHKIVPPQLYFASHPEYYALVNGIRNAEQVDFTNEEVYKLTVAYFKKAIAENPDALYWSISIGDGVVYDLGEKSKQIIAEEESPAGPVIRFVNRVAENFPEQYFTTLAYLWTAKPPVKTRPANNVIPFLSNIDAYRDKPLAEAASAASFRRNLMGWKSISDKVFLWDYTTQYTNYLGPFPDLNTLGPNALYYQQNGVKGIFVQGSENALSDLSDLKMYLLAKLLWNPSENVEQIQADFLAGYYGNAKPAVQEYITAREEARKISGRSLDIYGNPVQETNGWLSPDNLDRFSTMLDKAEATVETDTLLLARVQKLRLSLEYTVLQQSKYYGIEKFGFRIYDADKEQFVIKPNWPQRVSRFTKLALASGAIQMFEGGISPVAYEEEWNRILSEPYRTNLALEKTILIKQPFTEDWKGKGARTLIDGNRGYDDFSYNWLLFYGTEAEITVDLGSIKKLTSITTHFLDDPRHWIFAPDTAIIEVSEDGNIWQQVALYRNDQLETEHYEISRVNLSSSKPVKSRFIRIKAIPPAALPEYRYRANRKATIALDEIWAF